MIWRYDDLVVDNFFFLTISRIIFFLTIIPANLRQQDINLMSMTNNKLLTERLLSFNDKD